MTAAWAFGAAVALVALAGCAPERDAAGNATAKGEPEGTVFAASADGATGNVKLALPGAKLDLDLPAGLLNDGKFEIEGATLYPGSKVDSVDVKARRDDGGDDKASVRVAFTAPASADVVRAWMLSQTAGKPQPLRRTGDRLVGATKEGKAYTVTLTPLDGGRSRGLIAIEG